jgi:Magnesium chelatase, subunit ChlI
MHGGLPGGADHQAYDERAQKALKSVYEEYLGAILLSPAVRAWHHSMLGGGLVPLPGEVSRAHNGMLCLDDQPSAAAMCSRSRACHSARVSSAHDLVGIRDQASLAALVAVIMPVTAAMGASAWDLVVREGPMAPGEWPLRDAWQGSGMNGLRPRAAACPRLSSAPTTPCPARSALLDRSGFSLDTGLGLE